MDYNKLKTLLKGIIREAIREEFREIILEALKTSQKNTTNPIVAEQNLKPKKDVYVQMLKETMENNFIGSPHGKKFNPNISDIDTVNGALPEGEVDPMQIMNLLNK